MNDDDSNSHSRRIPLPKALFGIFISVLLISGSSFVGLLYFQHIRENRRHDPKYQIVALVQTSSDKEGLKTAFLTELLELSIDKPKNLFQFSAKEAQAKLLRFSVIKEAKVNKIRPGIIWVDYSLRKPVAYLGDFSNTFIDADGVPFPVSPFFTPKMLPEVYLGLTEDVGNDDEGAIRNFQWGTPLQNRKTALAFTVIDTANKYCCGDFTFLARVDVSKAFAQSYGQRQIVIVLEDRLEKEVEGQPILSINPKILRLSTENYEYQLKNYVVLQSYLREQESKSFDDHSTHLQQGKSTVVDLRLTDLAFITNKS